MISDACKRASESTTSRSDVESRLRAIIDLHFDPVYGSSYWLERAATLSIDPRREIQMLDDLHLLGDMTPRAQTVRPIRDFIPRAFHGQMERFIIAQTGGTTGAGAWSAWRSDEFHAAFIEPFIAAATALGFPQGRQWLFIGPSGPHAIGKVVRSLASSMHSADPFAIDFDPRWAKKLPEGSFARQRYLAHVVEQSMAVIDTQDVGVLFTTPPVLAALAHRMTDRQKDRIAAVHYGGLPISREQMRKFQADEFPNALHFSGYGNTLFGCCLELSTRLDREIDYFPHGDRLILDVVDSDGRTVPHGHCGQVRFTRLDESMLIVRMLERDVAIRRACPADAPEGFALDGVRDPHTPPDAVACAATGLY